MTPIFFEGQNLIDDEEIKTYERYLQLLDKIPRLSTLDYHSYVANQPDQILKQSKWTSFTEPLYLEDDYNHVKSRSDAFRDIKHDLETFDKFGNFDYTKLDSYKLE